MASLPNPAPIRCLRELLQEQQEPFFLDAYLREKGYSKRCCNSDTGRDCWFASVLKKNRQKCSKLMKSVLTKIPFGMILNMSDCDIKACDEGRFSDFGFSFDIRRLIRVTESDQFLPTSASKKMSCFNDFVSDNGRFSCSCNVSDMGRKATELDRYSSASSMTVFDSCSDGNMEETPSVQQDPISIDSFRALKIYSKEEEASTDRRLQCMEDCKQFSPVSVLELPFDEDYSGHNTQFFPRARRENPSISSFNLPEEVTKESIISASTWETLEHYFIRKQDLHGSYSSSAQYLKSKRVMQQKKQLLLDCVREALDSHEREGRSWDFHELEEHKNLEKLVCGQIFAWGKQGRDATKITQLMEYDLLECKQGWERFQPHLEEIGIEIGDAIFEEIRDEIVADILYSFELERN